MPRLWLVTVIIFFVAGCITPQQPRVPTTHIPITPSTASVDLSPPNVSALSGRAICIDAGHSVEIAGTASPSNGLQEAELNLRVALRVRDVLEQGGATVLMTRADEHALDPKNNGNDLALRAAFANARAADVFVSVHHNADITPGSEKNDLEVYYKLSDDGPSLDLAQHLTSALARRMRPEAPAKRLLPGNYKVLRLAEAPAVLLETSYLTHAPHAAFMATEAAINAESYAIADGLNAYFSLDPLKLAPPELVSNEYGETLRIRYAGAVSPLIDTVRVTVDGGDTEGAAAADADSILWRPALPLPNGLHAVNVVVQNGKGAWSRSLGSISIARPVAAIQLTQFPARVADIQGQRVAVYARALDRFGLPVADGVPVRVSGEDAPIKTVDGVAAVYRTMPGGALRVEADGFAATHVWIGGGEARVALRILDAATKAPVSGVAVESSEGTLQISDRLGWAWVQVGPVRFRHNGYEAFTGAAAGNEQRIDLSPVAGGVLHAKRIMLDPAHGGRSPGKIGPDGTRASDLNLAVVRRLAQRLTAAGARVVLTRSGDFEVPDSERVRQENNVEPDIFVRVSYGDSNESARVVDAKGHQIAAGPSYVGHYPGSARGSQLASAVAHALRIDAVVPCYLYVVQQAGAPAVIVQPGDVASGPSYADGASPVWAAADAAYQGILDFYRR